MADRVLRDEVFESDRFIDLPDNTCRVVFISFLSLADDFGNFEVAGRRLFRFLRNFNAVQDEAELPMVLKALERADLIRKYETEGRLFYHIPRFNQHRWYVCHKVPPSPWDVEGKAVDKNTRKVYNQGLAKNVVKQQRQVAEGVGVGVGEKLLSQKVSVDNSGPFVPNRKSQSSKTSERSLKVKSVPSTPKATPPPPRPGESMEDYRLRCSMTHHQEPTDVQPHPLTPPVPFVRSEIPTSIRATLAALKLPEREG